MGDILNNAVREALRYFNVLWMLSVVMLVADLRCYGVFFTRRASCCEALVIVRIVTCKNFVNKKNEAVADKR